MKKAILSVIALALCVLPQSCNKNNGGSEAAQTAKLGVSIKNAQEIYEVPKEELARMKEACAPIYEEFIGYGLGDLLDKIANA